ncbi:hypothetical protein HaLaN_04767 [Haematococcus lacustris]|uniref:Uncharacterized protein n=1 Tax=Haematococcus lacustris TaxID=44745 RepID=A0A699YJC6_HAELA|nr:hypothetical protein HaLaN_04767 [Haematococcus lacustris]
MQGYSSVPVRCAAGGAGAAVPGSFLGIKLRAGDGQQAELLTTLVPRLLSCCRVLNLHAAPREQLKAAMAAVPAPTTTLSLSSRARSCGRLCMTTAWVTPELHCHYTRRCTDKPGTQPGVVVPCLPYIEHPANPPALYLTTTGAVPRLPQQPATRLCVAPCPAEQPAPPGAAAVHWSGGSFPGSLRCAGSAGEVLWLYRCWQNKWTGCVQASACMCVECDTPLLANPVGPARYHPHPSHHHNMACTSHRGSRAAGQQGSSQRGGWVGRQHCSIAGPVDSTT